jgi:transposase
MNHPPAVCEKAQCLEHLLLRIEAGEPFDQVRADLGLNIEEEDLLKLQAKYEAGGRTWEALIDGRYGHPQKAHSALREWMYERKREDKSLAARELAEEIAEQFQVKLSIGHINYVLRKMELTRPRGRPRRCREEGEAAPASGAPCDESLDNAGIFFPRRGEARDGRGRDCADQPGGSRGLLSGSEPRGLPADDQQ